MTKLRRIVVNEKYTYLCSTPVEVGDTVLLPVPEWRSSPGNTTWKGVVTSLESDYEGPCEVAFGKVEDDG